MCTVLLTLIFLYKKNINNFFNKYQLLKQYNCFNILITIIVVGITANYVTLFYDYNNYLDEFIGSGKIKNIYDTNYNTTPLFSSKITEIVDQDKDYYKIGKTQSSIQNDALYLGYNSTDYYYSIVPNIIQQLGYDLSNFTYYTSSEIKQFDYRTRINTLLGKKYYVMEDDKNLPYGYEIIEEDKSNIYQNKYYVPFAQYYDKYITNEEYEKLSNIEKENSLLNNVVLDKTNNNDLTHNDNYQEKIDKNIKPLLFTMSDYSKKIVVTNNEENDKKNNEIEITIDPNQEFHGEIYLKINNLNYQPYTKSELYDLKTTKDKYSKRGFNKKYEHYEERYSYNLEIDFNEETYEKPTRDNRYDSYSSGSNNVLLNLGYFDNLADLEDNKITLTLSALGTYTYDNLEVLLVTFDDYEEDVANLNKSNYETIEYKNGYMKGTVDLEEPGIIQFATAYVDGWDLYIDGKKSEILNVNKYFLGTYMDKGKHTIELKYHTPLIKEGTIISLISLIIYIIVIIFDYRKNKVDLKK